MFSRDADLLRCQFTLLAICTNGDGRSRSASPISYSRTDSDHSTGLKSSIYRRLSRVCRSRSQATGRIDVLQSSERCCSARELFGYVAIHDRIDVYHPCRSQAQYSRACVEPWSTDGLLPTQWSMVDSRWRLVPRISASTSTEKYHYKGQID